MNRSCPYQKGTFRLNKHTAQLSWFLPFQWVMASQYPFFTKQMNGASPYRCPCWLFWSKNIDGDFLVFPWRFHHLGKPKSISPRPPMCPSPQVALALAPSRRTSSTWGATRRWRRRWPRSCPGSTTCPSRRLGAERKETNPRGGAAEGFCVFFSCCG